MEGFKAAFLNEAYKLVKRKKMNAAAILAILAVVVGQLAVTAVQHGLGLRIAGGAEFPLVVLSAFTYSLLPLFATFVAIDLFNGEFTSNTMKITLARPVSRFGVFSSKVAVLALFIAANLLFVMLLSLVAGLIFAPSSAGFGEAARVVLAYAVTFLPVFVFTLLVVLLANVVRGGLAVFFLSVLVFLAFLFAGVLLPNASSFLVTSMFQWHTLWISEHLNAFKLVRQGLIMAGFGVMLFTAGYMRFERKDL
jgi:ABC-2 type transport system permease protein